MDTQSDLTNAHLFAERYAATLRYLPALGWFQWTGQRWLPIDRDELIHLAECVLTASADDPSETSRKSTHSSIIARLKAIINLARCQPELRASCDQLDSDPFLLNVQNGTVDLRTATLLPHDPDNFLSYLIPHSFDPAATSPLWDAFLDQVTNHDPALQDYLQRAVGYSLTASTAENLFFILYGSGRNGKSTFLTALQYAFGDYFSSAPSHLFTSALLSKEQNSILTSLADARFVATLETRLDQPLHLSALKPVTSARNLSTRPYSPSAVTHSSLPTSMPLIPHFKLWLVTNNLPIISNDSFSFWHRLKLIPFTNRFFADTDKYLPQRLASAAPAILAWAVRGALLWYQSGLLEPPCVTTATTEYREEQDLLLLYFEDHCILDLQKHVRARDLYNDYVHWSQYRHLSPVTETTFCTRVARHGFERVRTSSGNIYRGLTIFSQLLADLKSNGTSIDTTPIAKTTGQDAAKDFMREH